MKESKIEKIIMGAIIGTAIGASLGTAMAPKKGKETRADLTEKASGLWGRLKRWAKGEAKQNALPLHGTKEIPVETESMHHE